jgi:hypothetical protein
VEGIPGQSLPSLNFLSLSPKEIHFSTSGIYRESNLVGGLEHDFYFSIQLGIVTPTDELLFFRGVRGRLNPPASKYSREFWG